MNCDIGLVPLIVQWPTHLQCLSHVPRGHAIVALGMFDPVRQGAVYCVCLLAMLEIMWFILSEIDVSFKLAVIVTWPTCSVAWLRCEFMLICATVWIKCMTVYTGKTFMTRKYFLTSFRLLFFLTSLYWFYSYKKCVIPNFYSQCAIRFWFLINFNIDFVANSIFADYLIRKSGKRVSGMNWI
jgi:hypothetical protein